MLNLTTKFYELIEEGFIYEEDENGHNMSYGEYVAIVEYGWELIENALTGIYDIIEFLETAQNIFDTADDDAAMFFGLDDEDRYMYIDEEEPFKSDISENLRNIMNKIEFNEYEYVA
jgi:hypothetical protein